MGQDGDCHPGGVDPIEPYLTEPKNVLRRLKEPLHRVNPDLSW